MTPSRPTKSISAETTFRADTGALERLNEAVQPLCERVARRLAEKNIAGKTLVLKLKTGDFKTLTAQPPALRPDAAVRGPVPDRKISD